MMPASSTKDSSRPLARTTGVSPRSAHSAATHLHAHTVSGSREPRPRSRDTHVVSSRPSAEKAMAPMAAGESGRRYSSGTAAHSVRAAPGSVPSGHSSHAVSLSGDRI